jgi:hypothetical protein
MINTIIIFFCTAINCAWGFYWIRQLNKQYKDRKRKRHHDLCKRCIEVGSCPHNCEICAWGDVMTERQLNQEKKVRKLWKNILKKN